MIRSLLRMLKHISLAIFALIAVVCIAEVGMRGHWLYQQSQNAGLCELIPQPCPVAFQQLLPLQQVTRQDPKTGEPVLIRTNRLGLRGRDVVIPKAQETFRIVCLGDDATFAAGVSEEQSFALLVQQQLTEQSGSPVEVVNAGLPGYCPLLTLAWAKQRLAGLQPDLVVLCCDYSDVGDDRRLRPMARFAIDGTLEGVCHPAAASGQPCLVQAVEQEFRLAALFRDQLSNLIGGEADDAVLPEGWEEAKESARHNSGMHVRQAWEPITELRDLCDRLAADFVVVAVPSDARDTMSAAGTAEIVRVLGETAHGAGVPFLDVTADFSPKSSPELFLPGDGRLSPAGHELFAQLLGWAILHRSQDTDSSKTSPSEIVITGGEQATEPMPAHVLPPSEPPVATPLPVPSRQRRVEEPPEWSRDR